MLNPPQQHALVAVNVVPVPVRVPVVVVIVLPAAVPIVVLEYSPRPSAAPHTDRYNIQHNTRTS